MPENFGREPGRERGGNQLTVELSRENPELYKKKLLVQLRANTEYSGQAWDLLINRGLIDSSSLHLDSSTWHGHTTIDKNDPRKQVIKLGTNEIPNAIRQKTIFHDHKFTGDQGIVYRLSHEIGHVVLPEAVDNDKSVEGLFKMAINMRENGNALSALGNLEMYNDPKTKAMEDVIELFNMYMISPDYLEEYLDYLTAPQFQENRDKNNLYTFTSDRIASHVFTRVQKGVENFIKS